MMPQKGKRPKSTIVVIHKPRRRFNIAVEALKSRTTRPSNHVPRCSPRLKAFLSLLPLSTVRYHLYSPPPARCRNFYKAKKMATPEKPVVVVGIDDSDHSFYALEWALDHFFAPYAPNFPFSLVIVHAKPSPASAIGLAGPGAADVLPYVDSDLKKIAARVIEKAKEISLSKSVNNVMLEVVEGDARNVLCEAVEKHHASMLAVGSHGYGAIKRAVLGSVSDYCAHHAHCSVMIVKRPKHKH